MPSHQRGRASARTRARMRAADTLFEAQVRGFGADPDGLRGLLAKRKVLSTHQAEPPAYAQQIVEGVADHIAEIDDALQTHSHDWTLDRMPNVDLVIMRIAVWEILFNEDVPDKVAINEAITVARQIGTDKAPGFLNAILDAISKDR